MKSKTELPAWDAPRGCDYCGVEFKPSRPQDAKQRFCTDNHRKDFFRYGAKLQVVAALSRVFDKRFRDMERRITALENKSGKPLDAVSEPVVTLQPEVKQ
jgi:hypothetical protein